MAETLKSLNWNEYYEWAWKIRIGYFLNAMEHESDLGRVLGKFDVINQKHLFDFQSDKPSEHNNPDPITGCQTVIGMLMMLCSLNDFTSVVELGAGYGRVLADLYLAGGPKVKYFGGEYSESGRRLMSKLGHIYPYPLIEPFFVDLNKLAESRLPSLMTDKEKEHVLIFTHHAIEQVRTVPEDFFGCISRFGKQVLGVHFEPFGFQMLREHGVAVQHEEFIKTRGWNENLWDVFNKAIAADHITPLLALQNVFMVSASNPTSVLMWKSKELKNG